MHWLRANCAWPAVSPSLMKWLVILLRGEQKTQTALMFNLAFDGIYHSVLVWKLWTVWSWRTDRWAQNYLSCEAWRVVRMGQMSSWQLVKSTLGVDSGLISFNIISNNLDDEIAPVAITPLPFIYVYWLVTEPVRLLYFSGGRLGISATAGSCNTWSSANYGKLLNRLGLLASIKIKKGPWWSNMWDLARSSSVSSLKSYNQVEAVQPQGGFSYCFSKS